MKGFTLLELMVSIIIIGILAAVAVPQYQKAVEKSRAAEALTLGKSIVEAQNRSLDAYPDDSVATKSAIDVQLSSGTWSSNTVYTTKDFTYTLTEQGVEISRSDKYTLFMGNNNATTADYCMGSICGTMQGMGFTVKTTAEN